MFIGDNKTFSQSGKVIAADSFVLHIDKASREMWFYFEPSIFGSSFLVECQKLLAITGLIVLYAVVRFFKLSDLYIIKEKIGRRFLKAEFCVNWCAHIRCNELDALAFFAICYMNKFLGDVFPIAFSSFIGSNDNMSQPGYVTMDNGRTYGDNFLIDQEFYGKTKRAFYIVLYFDRDIAPSFRT